MSGVLVAPPRFQNGIEMLVKKIIFKNMAKIANGHNSKPGAWVANTLDKGRKPIKNGKVYMRDGEEFQIELFNPLRDCVLADIKLNGASVSKNGLVIKPGQRFYLDCFIDDNKKLVFREYEAEDTEEGHSATEKNGLLEVFFYKESVVSLDGWRTKFDRLIVERHHTYYPYNPYPTWINTPNIYFGTNTVAGMDTNIVTTTNSCNIPPMAGTTVNALYSNTGSFATGRVEKGPESSQQFDEVDMQFDSLYIASTVVQLLPESRKPAETKEIKAGQARNDAGSKNRQDAIELIKKLADLKDAGILTESEFSAKKAELLSRI